VPIFAGGKIVAVLDIDSEHLATFDATDKEWLERIVALFAR
jgi:putative methionine-R-sulfoxide reductase with GAF domain